MKSLTVNAEAETTQEIIDLLKNVLEQMENGKDGEFNDSIFWSLDG